MCAGKSSSAFSYDSMGRRSERRANLGITQKAFSTTYTYYKDGSVNTITYPSGDIVTYTVGGAGRTTNVSDPSNNYVAPPSTAPMYTPSGLLVGMTNGSGIQTADAFNSRLQAATLQASTTAATFMSLSYDFHLANGDNGNVFQIVNKLDSTRSRAFQYDPLNRLAQANTTTTTGANCWGEVYTVDNWGNLTNRSGPSGMTGCSTEPLSQTVNASNQLSGVSYDAAGNVTNDGNGNTPTYDAENRIVTDQGFTYSYDAEGMRIEKSSGSVGTMYWPDSSGNTLTETDLNDNITEEYVFFNGSRIARIDRPSGTVHYYFSDHLGSHTVVTNASGQCEQDIDYYPYGGVIAEHCPTPIAQHYKFTGKEHDTESGLDNFGVRYNASSMGRFMQADPITVTAARQVDPQQMNLYAYVRNNPLKLIDPTGMIIDETHLSEEDLEKWQEVERLAAQQNSNGNLLYPELNSEIVELQQDSRTYTLQGGTGLSSTDAGRFEITNFTAGGRDFTTATIRLDFNKISSGKGVTPAIFNLGYAKFGGLNDNPRRFAELVGHEFAHGLFAMFMPGVGTDIQQRVNEGLNAFNTFRSTNKKAPLPPDVLQKMEAGNNALVPTERFAQQIEKIVNGELQASEHK